MTTRVIPAHFSQGQVIYSRDHRLKTIGHQLEHAIIENNRRGPVVSPPRTLRDGLGLLGTDGGRLWLGEGIWNFNSMLTIARHNVHIVSTSPGKTLFIRRVSSSDPILKFNGRECSITGVRFIDEHASTRGPAIQMTQVRGAVRNCVFENVYEGIDMNGGNYCEVSSCLFLGATNAGVRYSGTSTGGLIVGNRFETTASAGDIYLGDSVTETGIYSNVFDFGSSTISVKTGTGIQARAQVANTNTILDTQVTVRP